MARLSRYDVRREPLERDGFDLATACAALQLLPANATHLDRLCALAATALGSGTHASPLATEADLERLLIRGPSLHRGPRWDPYEGPFAEPINFYGGGYLLQTGGNAEAVFNLQTLLNAAFAPSEPLGNRDFSRHLSQFTRSVLSLATHVRASLGTSHAGHLLRVQRPCSLHRPPLCPFCVQACGSRAESSWQLPTPTPTFLSQSFMT